MKRILCLTAAYLFLLSILALLIVSSPWGLRRVVLPLAAHLSGLRLEASRIELFKRHTIEISGFVLESSPSMLVSLRHGSVDVELGKLLQADYSVRALLVDGLNVKVSSAAEKASPPATPEGGASRPAAQSGSSALPRVSLQNTKIRDSRFTLAGKDGLSLNVSSIDADFLVCGIGVDCSTNGRFEIEYQKASPHQHVAATARLKGRARLTESAKVENYSMNLGLEPLSISGLPVRFENGLLHVELRGRSPFEEANDIEVRWKELSVPEKVAASEGQIKTQLTFSPEKQITFAKTELQLIDAKHVYASLTADGAFQLKDKALSGNFVIPHFDDRFFRLFPGIPRDIEKLGFKAELRPVLRFQDGVAGELGLSLELENLQVKAPSFPAETLRGSTVRAVAKLANSEINVENLQLNLLKGGQPIFDVSGGAQILQPLAVRAELSSRKVSVQQIQALLGTKAAPSDPPHPEKAPAKGADPEVSLPPLPPLDIQYKAAEVDSEEAKFADLRLALKHTLEHGARALAVQLSATGGSAPITSEAHVSSRDGQGLHLTFKAGTKMLKLNELLKPSANLTGGADPGTIKSLALDMGMQGHRQSELYHSLAGKLAFHSSDLQLPSKFQSIPPFNLIFIPLDIVANITGSTAGLLLPAQLTKTASGLRSSLSDRGKIHIDKVDLELEVKDKQVKISQGLISPNLLPGMEYTGTVGLDGSLDLRVFLTILGVRLPLPIAGTIHTPLPNAVRFVPELVRGLGLSALDGVEGGLGVIKDGFDGLTGRSPAKAKEE